jgi:hypothetical protein
MVSVGSDKPITAAIGIKPLSIRLRLLGHIVPETRFSGNGIWTFGNAGQF